MQGPVLVRPSGQRREQPAGQSPGDLCHPADGPPLLAGAMRHEPPSAPSGGPRRSRPRRHACLARAVDFTRLAWQLWEAAERNQWWASCSGWSIMRRWMPGSVSPQSSTSFLPSLWRSRSRPPPSPAFAEGASAAWHCCDCSRRRVPKRPAGKTTRHPSSSCGVKSGQWEVVDGGRRAGLEHR